MAEKKSNVEARQEVLDDDSTRDVNIHLAVFVAGSSILSSGAGALAVIAIVFLANFRQDVEDLWLSCIPLCFTFVTGVAVAYRKQMADVGVHIALAVTTLLAGGAGYGLSVEHVYFNRENCTVAEGYHGDCNREILTSIYFFAGAVASGFAVFGFLASLCACSNAMSRRRTREKYRMMRLEYEENIRKVEVRDQQRKLGQSAFAPPATTHTPNGTFDKPAQPPTMNGVNGIDNTQKTPVHTTVQSLTGPDKKLPSVQTQIIEEQPEMIDELPEITEQQLPEVEKKQPEVVKEQQQVVKDQPEVVKQAPEILKDVPRINTTTIIVREIPAEKKQTGGGVDRGTQVDPLDHVVEPATKDVGVSPYQEEEDDDVKPVSINQVPAASTDENVKVQNSENEKAAKVMTHL